MTSATPSRPIRRGGGSLAGSSLPKSSGGLLDAKMMTRTITAVVGIPLVVLIVIVGGSVYKAVIVAIAMIAAWEAYRMLRGRGHKPALPLGLAMTGILALAPGLSNPLEWWRGVVLLGAMTAALWFLLSERTQQAFLDWTLTIVVAVYVGGFLGSLVATRELTDGLRLVLLVFVLTWAYDTGAYVIGREWGQTPFMSKISSRKTWEGVAGGLAFAVAAGLIAFMPTKTGLVTALLAALAVAGAAQLGDLLESLLKRYSGVKDSGTMIPGHGGLMDRIDSLLLAGTAAYYVFLGAGFR